MKISRRQFLGITGAAAGGAIAADAFIIEPNDVEFTFHDIGRTGGSGPAVRFAQLSDLHLSDIGRMHRTIASRLRALDLDFILLTGDAVDDNYSLEALDHFLGLLPRGIPLYAILGNWEQWGHVRKKDLAALYARHGGRLLINETAIARAGGEPILITGLDDFIGGIPSIERALAGVEPEAHHLLLAHCPVYRDYIADYTDLAHADTSRFTAPIDLDAYPISHVLSGHTHGGQVNVFGMRPFMPQGSGEYVQGWYKGKGPELYVSRGIGTSILPVRFGARPEVAVFTMRLGGR